MKRWVSETYAFVGYVLFFGLAWLIAAPILLILRLLVNTVDRMHTALAVSLVLKGLLYLLMVATLMVATIAALVVTLTLAKRKADRNEGTSGPNQPPSS